VACFVERAVSDPAMRGVALDVGGPENLSMRQVAQTFGLVTGRTGSVGAVPLPLMRLLAVLLRPANARVARQIQAGVVMDTRDLSFDPAQTSCRYPSITLTSMAEVARRDYSSGVHAEALKAP
ncbi:MAG TPA: hypothetical protein VIJ28_05545, partial [Chloroflexota bacterium]